MGEGVDPTQMCQSLVNKVAQSEQLSAITDPDVLVLFEDWLEELENEVQTIYKADVGWMKILLPESSDFPAEEQNFFCPKGHGKEK